MKNHLLTRVFGSLMDSQEYSFERFDTLFYPKHIAFIGASEKSRFGSMLYLVAFKESKWAETFYPVNPKYDKILDWKCYPSVLEIPFPVDTAYLSVKTRFIPQVLKECVRKKISWVIIFASGFSETGEETGIRLENEIKEIIRGSQTRVIGPNCLGPFNGKNGMAFTFNSPMGIPGHVSFMSQSGGHLNQLLDVGVKRDIRFRYGVSFGNQIDLNCIDFIRHFRKDDDTRVVAAYLESFGSGNGQEFLKELKKITKIKPVIIWKGGYTDYGSRAAFSHTGALSSKRVYWNAIIKQSGAVRVYNNEEFWDAIKTFELLFPKFMPKGRSVGIVTPGGGSSVNATDLLAAKGLQIPELSLKSQEDLSKILPRENVNIKNPVDLGALGFVLEVFAKCMQIVMHDSKIDIILMPLWPHFMYTHVFTKLLNILQSQEKPFAFCLPSIADSLDLAKKFAKVQKVLHKERALYFFSLRDAANSLSLLCDYHEYIQSPNS